MTMELSPEEERIVRAFYARYDPIAQGLREILDETDQAEYRRRVATVVPFASEFLERHTREELQTLLIALTIGVAVAAAVAEGLRISRESEAWPG